jgi:hypothetical protein
MSSALHLHCALLRRHCARRRVPCLRCAAASLRVAAPHRLQSSSGRLANRLSRPPRAGAELLADPWSVSSESLAASLFAVSLAPYTVFLFYLFRAKGPPLMNFGFAFLLVFVFATIPAGIYGACRTLYARLSLVANNASRTTRSQERLRHLARKC